MNNVKLGLVSLVLVILNCLDVATTVYAMGQGYGMEANPLVNFGPVQFLFKLFLPLMFVLPLVVAYRIAIKERRSRMAKGLCVLLIGVTLYLLVIVTNNLIILMRGLGYA
jgi:hypothetical protein